MRQSRGDELGQRHYGPSARGSRVVPATISYNARASGAGPRRIPKATTRTARASRPRGIVSTSPHLMPSPDFTTRAPFNRTTPDSAAFCASTRERKNRACQSHLSMRMRSSFGTFLLPDECGQLGKGRVGADLDFHLRLPCPIAACATFARLSPNGCRALPAIDDVHAVPAEMGKHVAQLVIAAAE